MFEEFKRKTKQNAKTVIDCQDGIFGAVFAQRPYVLVFKTTNYCWNNCAHCCEKSGIHNPKTFIPQDVIAGYLDQAATDKNFRGEVVFTGGEAMSAYKFADERYIPNIINAALHNKNRKIGVDIKTNAGWVTGAFADTIFKDIEKIIRSKAPKDAAAQGFKTIVPFQVSLSLDKFHKDSLQRNFIFIKHFADLNIPGAALSISISSFERDKSMFKELSDKLRACGIKIEEMAVFDEKKGVVPRPFYSLNGNVVVRMGCGKLFNGGRAADIDWAYKTPYPQFVFVDHDINTLVAFDSFGNVTLGENSGKKISTPWRDKNGEPLPLSTIRENLIAETKRAEQEFLAQHKIMDGYFRWLRKVIQKRQEQERK